MLAVLCCPASRLFSPSLFVIVYYSVCPFIITSYSPTATTQVGLHNSSSFILARHHHQRYTSTPIFFFCLTLPIHPFRLHFGLALPSPISLPFPIKPSLRRLLLPRAAFFGAAVARAAIPLHYHKRLFFASFNLLSFWLYVHFLAPMRFLGYV